MEKKEKRDPIATDFDVPEAALKWKSEVKIGNPVEDLVPDGPILITENTYGKLLLDYNMELDVSVRRMREHNDGRVTPFHRGITITNDYLTYFKRTDPQREHMFGNIQDWVRNKNYTNKGDVWLQNTALVGFVVVFKAFHHELGEDFMKNIEDSSPESLTKAFRDMSVQFVPSISQSIIDRVARDNRIPDDQIFLNKYIQDYGDEINQNEFALLDGVETAYHVIDQLNLATVRLSTEGVE